MFGQSMFGGPSFGPGNSIAIDYVEPSSVVLQYIIADSGYIIRDESNRISQWTDISGNGHHYIQNNSANKPLYNAVGAPNSKPIVSIDSVARFMSSTLTTPLRTTTPTTMWIIGRQVTWANGRRIISDTTNLKKLLVQDTSTPQIDMYDGGSVGNNDGGTIGSFARILVNWTTAPAECRLKIGAINNTGLNPAAAAADVGRLLGNNAGSSAIFDFCEVLYMNRALTSQEESDLDNIHIPARYGAGNILV